jgi:recombinational DNA repair protein (RecF pathway)
VPRSSAGFYVPDGGVICGACAIGLEEAVLPVHLGTLRALQRGLEYDLDRLERLVLGPQALAEAEHLLFRFQRFHVGLELRSERFLHQSLHSGSLTPPPP